MTAGCKDDAVLDFEKADNAEAVLERDEDHKPGDGPHDTPGGRRKPFFDLGRKEKNGK